MRLVFFGTPESAVPVLEAITRHHEIGGVVCQPDKPKGRSKKPLPPPVKVFAEAHGQEVCQSAKLNDGTFEAWLKSRKPELCVVAAYGRILKQPILDVPPRGYLNVHPSLLPKYRGPSPIQTALLNGDETTGVTIMAIDAGMDSGGVLLQREVVIAPEDDAVTLSDRLFAIGAEMMVEGVALVESGKAQFTPQDESQVTVTRLFEKADGMIDWSNAAMEIHNQVRACVPWPVAYTFLDGESYRIHKAHVAEAAPSGKPGEIVEISKDRLIVATGHGALAVDVIQAPGKRAMPVADFLLGAKLVVGDTFDRDGV